MASGVGRLGSVLSDLSIHAEAAAAAVAADDIVELLELLVAGSSPNGAEGPLAESVADWVRGRSSDARVRTEQLGGERVNLQVDLGGPLADAVGVYAHLDTSLTGDPARDRWITGRDDPVAPLTISGGWVTGHGVAVAKGSVATGVVAALAAHRVLDDAGLQHAIGILLASGGTHRAPQQWERPSSGPATFGPGVRHALSTGWRPRSVLNVKAGAPAPVLEEPGAAYLQIEVSGSWDPVLFRDEDPGTLAAVGPTLAGIEAARRRWRELPTVGSVGRELGVGALRAGDLDKPDLLPAHLQLAAFAVLAPGDDPDDLVEMVSEAIHAELRAAGLEHLDARVGLTTIDQAQPGAATSPLSSLAVSVGQRWAARFGPPPPLEDWRGSTDSVVLRAAGIPTVRCGPLVSRDPGDLRLDRVQLEVLVDFARLYAEVLVLESARRDAA